MVYRIERQNQTWGPYTLEQVRSLAQAGQVLPEDLVRAEGAAQPTSVAMLLHATKGDSTGGLIPYKNAPALVGYYLAVASLIPCIGLFTGIAAFILGMKGLKKVKAEPWVRGTAHAWIGVIGGGLLGLLNLAGLVVVAVTIYQSEARRQEERSEYESRRMRSSTAPVQEHFDRRLHAAEDVVHRLAA